MIDRTCGCTLRPCSCLAQIVRGQPSAGGLHLCRMEHIVFEYFAVNRQTGLIACQRPGKFQSVLSGLQGNRVVNNLKGPSRLCCALRNQDISARSESGDRCKSIGAVGIVKGIYVLDRGRGFRRYRVPASRGHVFYQLGLIVVDKTSHLKLISRPD